MEKEQNQNSEEFKNKESISDKNDQNPEVTPLKEAEPKEKTSEELILELEDKLTRTFAEMEN